MKNRQIPLIIGLILAVGTATLLLGYVNWLRPAVSTVPTVPVLIAARDIAARAPIAAADFTLGRRNATDVDPDAIGDPKNVAGKYALVSIPKGSVLTSSRIGVSTALPAKLAPGMRAVSISIDEVKGVAGLITPGDRVDVIAVPPRVGNQTPRGYAILRGVLVLAMGAEIRTLAATASPISGRPALTTVTLGLTPGQADILAGADVNTVLRLSLRNPTEAIRAFPVEPLELAPVEPAPVAIPPPSAATIVAPPPQAALPRAGTASQGVIVIDGDRVVTGGAAAR